MKHLEDTLSLWSQLNSYRCSCLLVKETQDNIPLYTYMYVHMHAQLHIYMVHVYVYTCSSCGSWCTKTGYIHSKVKFGHTSLWSNVWKVAGDVCIGKKKNLCCYFLFKHPFSLSHEIDNFYHFLSINIYNLSLFVTEIANKSQILLGHKSMMPLECFIGTCKILLT